MKKMKRLLAAVMVLVCVLVLAGCSNGVKETISAIDAIAAAENKAQAVNAADELYAKLSDEQKAKVTNADILLVAKTERAIDGIGYVSEFAVMGALKEESAISKASTLYNALTEEQKKQVSNADKLTKASGLLSQAKQTQSTVQTFAEKLFLKFAKAFKHPESIQLQHAWYATMGGSLHDFTFQFNVKNGVGIVENVYYGTSISFTELTDESISKWVSGFRMLGEGSYFGEGETGAMDQAAKGYGVELNATSIQQYFQRNR